MGYAECARGSDWRTVPCADGCARTECRRRPDVVHIKFVFVRWHFPFKTFRATQCGCGGRGAFFLLLAFLAAARRRRRRRRAPPWWWPHYNIYIYLVTVTGSFEWREASLTIATSEPQYGRSSVRQNRMVRSGFGMKEAPEVGATATSVQ